MKNLFIVSITKTAQTLINNINDNWGVKIESLPEIVPNIISSTFFSSKISTNGKKQIKIKFYTNELYVFVCNSGNSVSLKELKNQEMFKPSKFNIRIENKKPVLMCRDQKICDFLNVPIQSNVIYWVSWKTKNHKTLRNRCDVFCLFKGELTNKLIDPKNKINKKYSKPFDK